LTRIMSWRTLDAAGAPDVLGAPLRDGEPAAQSAPARGTAPRIDVTRAARRLRATAHTLLGYAGADGYPIVVPVAVGSAFNVTVNGCYYRIVESFRQDGRVHNHRRQFLQLLLFRRYVRRASRTLRQKLARAAYQ